jgi:hypothetical protein
VSQYHTLSSTSENPEHAAKVWWGRRVKMKRKERARRNVFIKMDLGNKSHGDHGTIIVCQIKVKF